MALSDRVLGGIISAGSGVLGSIGSFFNQRQVIKSQQKENQLNREFNAREAEKSREHTLDMWNRTNTYNDPSQVIQRLSKAGLHPALAFGGFANSTPIASGSSASSSSSISPPSMDFSGISSAGAASVAAYNQSKLTDADVRLKESEAAKNEAEVPYIKQRNELDNKLKAIGIEVSKQQLSNDIEVGKKLVQEVENLKRAGRLTEQQIKVAQSEAHIKSIEAKFAETKELALIDNLLSSAELSKGQLLRITTLITAEYQNLIASANLSNSQAANNMFDLAVKNAMKALKGFGGIADDTLQQIESTIKHLQSSADSNKKNADTNSRNADTNETGTYLGFISSILSLGTKIISGN